MLAVAMVVTSGFPDDHEISRSHEANLEQA